MSPRTNPIQSFLRFFFRHLYTTIAWSYDLVALAASMGQWRSWQNAGTELLPPGRTLEIGYGTGHMMHSLTEEGKEIFGIDLSKQMSRITLRRLKNHNLPINLCQANAQRLPFPNDAFHSVFSTFPSEYIFEKDTFNEIWRVLKPRGIFIIIPGVSQIFGWKRRKRFVSLLDEVASLLYRLTGEAIGTKNNWMENFKKRLGDLGFATEIECVEQDRAIVLRIIARKQPIVD